MSLEIRCLKIFENIAFQTPFTKYSALYATTNITCIRIKLIVYCVNAYSEKHVGGRSFFNIHNHSFK